MGFETVSLQDVDIYLYDMIQTLPPIPHLPQFINDIREHYRAVQVVLRRDFFNFSLLAHVEDVDHHSPRFRLRASRFRDTDIRDWIMEITSMFSAKLSTLEELHIVFEVGQEEVIP